MLLYTEVNGYCLLVADVLGAQILEWRSTASVRNAPKAT